MFKRYWREFPWFLQLTLFVLMVFTLGSLGTYLADIVIVKAHGVSIRDLQKTTINAQTDPSKLAAMRLFQGVTHAFIFLLPCLLFGYLTHPRPWSYLGLRKPARPVHLLALVLIIAGALPFFTGLDGMLRHIDFGASIKKVQATNDAMMEGLLQQHNTGEFLLTLFIMAFLPAMGEELLFRGIIMRFVARRNRNMLFPLLVSAIAFAVVHFNPYGLFSIFLAGVLMGVIYWLTGSLWMSIVGHFLFNGTQVALFFIANNNPALKAFLVSNQMPAYMPVAGAVVLALGLFLLWKMRTPLAPGWTEDFTPEEQAERSDKPPFSFM